MCIRDSEGTYHMVWYTTPEGSVMMRYNLHYTGTDANGIKYVENLTRTMEHWAWPAMAPLSDEIVMKLVSKGSTPNATIVLTIEYTTIWPAPYVRTVECRG